MHFDFAQNRRAQRAVSIFFETICLPHGDRVLALAIDHAGGDADADRQMDNGKTATETCQAAHDIVEDGKQPQVIGVLVPTWLVLTLWCGCVTW